MLGFPLALLVANGLEWYAHKYVLHGVARPGQPRYSPLPRSMESHWAHHKQVRLQGYGDDAYAQGLRHWRTRNEVASLLAVTGVITLAAPVAPFFVLGSYYAAGRYFYVHRRSHLDPAWGRRTIPWHYDHHMQAHQDANWCVTRPWFDYLMGTRVIVDAAHAETNPLGVSLPRGLERALQAWRRCRHPAPLAGLLRRRV